MKRFKDLKISTKLLFCFALIAVIAGLIGWTGLSSVSKIDAAASSIYSQQLVQIRNLGYANADLHAANVEMRNMLLDKDVAGRQKYVELINAKDANIDGYVDIYSSCSLEKREQEMLSIFNASNEQYRQKRAKVVELLLKGHDDAAWKLLNSELTEATAATSEKLKNLVAINAQLAEQHQKENEATSTTAKITVLTLLLVGVFTSLALGWLMSRMIARPLGAMQSCAERLAAGDVNVTVDHDSKDELGALACAFRAMIDMITDRAALAQHIAGGDVSMEVKPRSAQDELGNAFLQVVNTIRKLTEEANNLTTAATQGKLATRGNAQQFDGDYRRILEGVNATLDAVIGPLSVAADCFNKIGKGQIPQRIEEEYSGEFAVLKDSVNSCITGLDGLQEVNAVLQRIALNDFTTNVEGQYPGLFGEVGSATNDALLRLRSAVEALQMVADGNFREKLAAFKKIAKRSENDSFMPGFIKAMESIVALVDDTAALATDAVQGKLGTRADATRHSGDYRKVVEGVNATLDSVVAPLQEVKQTLAKLADGDFTARIETQFAGEFDELKNALNSMVAQVNNALLNIGKEANSLASSSEQLGQVSDQMSASAEETAAQANVVSAASEQVSTNIQTVATGADEMGASIKEIAKNTADATKIANNAVQLSKTTNDTVRKLGASSEEIGQVIKVITSIAQQTNLLALNATIEAARAGEAGKGFAVVANEVKELAKQTAQATEDISQKIQAIQQDAGGAVTAIAEITEVIGQISDIQNTVATAIEEQSATTNEISRNLAEAAKGGSDITLNITSMAQVAKTTAEAAGQTQMSAKSLEVTAGQLRELVSQFRYEGVSPVAHASR